MFLYRDILKKSLALSWKHKYLWFFGIFAALLGGVGRYSMSMSRMPEDWSTSVFSALAIFFSGASNTGNVFSNLFDLFRRDPISAIIFCVFALIVIVLCLFLLWLAVISQAGLINNGAKIIKGNGKEIRTTIKEGIEAGIKKFWPVLGFNLIAAALSCFFAVLVGLPLIFLTPQSDLSVYLLYVLLFILFIPLSLIISFLVKYAVCFSVIKGRPFVDSFVEAINLFGKYWLVSIEMALILFMIDFLFVVVLGMIVLILAIPYIFIARVASLAFFVVLGADNLFQWALMAGLLITLALVILAGAAITSFKTVAWTDIFIELTEKKGGLAKLERLAAKLKK